MFTPHHVPVLGQGTLGGAIVSQAVLNEGQEEKPRYGAVDLAPCMFQDDLANGSVGLLAARVANQKVDCLSKRGDSS